jgi:hypothetical protein
MRKHHNKLYYGRFRHKTIFKIPGSVMFYPTTNEYLKTIKERYPGYADMNYLAEFIMENRNHMKFRFQDRKAIFYSGQSTAQQLIKKFWNYWIGSDTVDPALQELGPNTIGCTRLPHGKYQYQVYLKKERANLWEFIERNVEDCLVSNYNVLDYLEARNPYCFGGYFYVKEEKYLTPIYMMAQEAIDKIIKFRKVDKNGSNKKVTR